MMPPMSGGGCTSKDDEGGRRRASIYFRLVCLLGPSRPYRRGALFVVHAAGLDDDEAFFAIDAADVAAVHRDEAGFENAKVGFPDGFFKSFEAHALRVTVTMDIAGRIDAQATVFDRDEVRLRRILSGSSKLL